MACFRTPDPPLTTGPERSPTGVPSRERDPIPAGLRSPPDNARRAQKPSMKRGERQRLRREKRTPSVRRFRRPERSALRQERRAPGALQWLAGSDRPRLIGFHNDRRQFLAENPNAVYNATHEDPGSRHAVLRKGRRARFYRICRGSLPGRAAQRKLLPRPGYRAPLITLRKFSMRERIWTEADGKRKETAPVRSRNGRTCSLRQENGRDPELDPIRGTTGPWI